MIDNRLKKKKTLFMIALVALLFAALSAFAVSTADKNVAYAADFSTPVDFVEGDAKTLTYNVRWTTTTALGEGTNDNHSAASNVQVEFDAIPSVTYSNFTPYKIEGNRITFHLTAGAAESHGGTLNATVKVAGYPKKVALTNGATGAIGKRDLGGTVVLTTSGHQAVSVDMYAKKEATHSTNVSCSDPLKSVEITYSSNTIDIPKIGATKTYFTATGKTTYGLDLKVSGAKILNANLDTLDVKGITIGSDSNGMYLSITNEANNNSKFSYKIVLYVKYLDGTVTKTEDRTEESAGFTLNKTKYNVTFNSSGGSSVAEAEIPDGVAVRLPLPSKAGYTFLCWRDDVSGMEYKADIMIRIFADTSYTAIWQLKEPTITSASGYSAVYDGASHDISVEASHVPGVTLTYQWYKRSTGSAVIATTSTLSVTNVSDSGTYYCVVTARVGSESKTKNSPDISVAIRKATYNMSGVTFTNSSYVYDGTQKSLTVSGTLPPGVSVVYTVNSRTDAGSTGVDAEFSGDFDNYNTIPTKTATLTITPRQVAAVWSKSNSYVYTGANQIGTIKASFTGVGGQIPLPVTIASGGSEFKNAGTYSFSASNSNGNYSVSKLTLTGVVIGKAPLFVAADNQSVAYGDTFTAYTVSYGGFVVGDNASVLDGTLSYTCSYQVGSIVGTYAITPSGLTSGNYSLSYKDGTLTVNKREITVTIDGKKSTYGSSLVELTSQVTAGTVVNSDDLGIVLTKAGGNNATTYGITGTASNTNYAVTWVDGTYTITPKEVTLTWAEIADLVYSGQAKTTTAIAGGLIGEDICNVTIELSIGDNKNVGKFTFYAKGLDNNNYKLPSIVTSGEYEITSKPVEAEWSKSDSYVYTGASQIDTVLASFTGVGGQISLDVTITSGGSEFKNAGTYSFSVSNSDGNYSVSNPTLTGVVINKATVNKPVLTDNLVYNGANQTANLTSGTLYGISGNTGKNASDSYSATVTLIDTQNYKWEGVTGETESAALVIPWKIAKAPLTVTAEDKTIEFDEYPPEYTVRFEGFVGSENESNAQFSAQFLPTCAYIKGNSPGDYTITLPEDITAPNYSITVIFGTLNVKDIITIAFDGNGSTGGTMISQIMKEGEEAALTQNGYTKDGYYFDGWNTKSDGTGTYYIDGQSVTDLAGTGETFTLYATWKQITSAVLNFTANGDGSYTVAGIDKAHTYNTTNAANLAIVIPATYQGKNVTAIANNAFLASSNTGFTFTSLNLWGATNLLTIGESAFYNCVELESVTIPASVTSIGISAFYGCSSLTTLDLSGAVKLKTIENHAFSGCSELTSIDLSGTENLQSIGNFAFSGCSRLTTLDLSGATNLQTIGDNAFAGCSVLTSLDLSGAINLLTIGEYAFNGCSGLASLDLTNATKLQTIGNYAFQNCVNLESVTLSASVTSIGNYAFFGCSGLTTLDLFGAAKLETIGEAAFYNCEKLESVTIPASVTNIGIFAFFGCSGMTTIDLSIAIKLETIESSVFQNCVKLERVTIPASVTSIGNSAFYNCSGLTTLNLANATKLQTIGNYAFFDCRGLNSLDLSGAANLQAIGNYAFGNCSILTSLDLTNSAKLETIGNSAFSSCSRLTFLDLTKATKLKTIGEKAFFGCKELTTVYLPYNDSVTYGISVFYNVTCPIIAPSKEKYETYKTSGTLAGYANLTYQTTVTFIANGGTFTDSAAASQDKLFGFALNYVKNVDTGIWAANADYTFPSATLSGFVLGGYLDSANVAITTATTAADAAEYTAQWNLNAPEITETFGYNGTYDKVSHKISVTASHAGSGVTLSYKWYKGGATEDVLSTDSTLSLMTVLESGTYYCVVTATDGNGSQTTSVTSIGIVVLIEKADYDMSGVTFENDSFVYDGEQKSLAIGGTLPAGVTVHYSGNNGLLNAGSTTVTAIFTGDDADNYNLIDNMTATLTVTARPVTVTIDDKTSIYGNALDTLTARVTFGDVVSGDTDIYTLSTTATATSNIGGGYTITGTGGNNNYDITFAPAIYTVTARTLTIAMVDEIGNVVYNGQAQEPNVSISDGSLLKVSDYELAFADNTDAGIATVTITAKGNYTGLFTVNFTIDKATHDMSGVSFADGSVVESGETHGLSLTGRLPEGVSVEYIGNGKTLPGVYAVIARFTLADTKNYNAIVDMAATLTIKIKQVEKEEGEIVIDAGDAGIDPNAVVEIIRTDEKPQADFEKRENVVNTYEITIKKEGVAVQPDGTLTIRLLISESFRDKYFIKVYHVENGVLTDMNAVRDGDYMVFTTDHLSTFSMTAEKDLFNLILLLSVGGGLLLLLIVLAVLLKAKKKRTLAAANGATVFDTACTAENTAFNVFMPVFVPSFPEEADETEEAKTADETEAAKLAEFSAQAEVLATVGDEEKTEVFKGIEAHTGLAILARYRKSFLAKLIQSSDETKRYYSDCKNALLSYKKVSSRISWSYDSVNLGRTKLAKFNVRGKTLYLYLALNPDDFADTKYKVERTESKKYDSTPCLYKIKNDRRAKYALELIATLAERYALHAGETQTEDYAAENPYDTTESLIARELIKELISKENYEQYLKRQKQQELDGKKREFVSASEVSSLLSDEVAATLIEETNIQSAKKSGKAEKRVRGIINIDKISEAFGAGDTVTLSALQGKSLLSKSVNHVKVLARGALNKPLTVEANEFSIEAVKMILLTGGKVIKIKD